MIFNKRYAAAAVALLVGAAIWPLTGAISAPSPQPAPKPSLPPPHVLEPDFFDANDCQLMPVSDQPDAEWKSYCGPGEAVADSPPASSDGAWEALRGFIGPRYTTDVATQKPVVLEDSITISDQGAWRAWGLVRNASSRPMGVRVIASLYDGTGNLLETVRGTSAVDPLRSGEPGPFSLSSSIATINVARVQWSAEPLPAGPGVHRDFRILQDWTLPYGDRERFDLVYSDPDSGPPYPFVFAGDVDNLSGTVRNPAVVAAWLDGAGRVRWVASAPTGVVPFNPGRAASFPNLLPPRATAPFFLTVDDPAIGSLLGGFTPMLWAVGS